jgi:hypothetical protein
MRPDRTRCPARAGSALAAVVAVAFLSACAPRAATPKTTLRAYLTALESGDSSGPTS